MLGLRGGEDTLPRSPPGTEWEPLDAPAAAGAGGAGAAEQYAAVARSCRQATVLDEPRPRARTGSAAVAVGVVVIGQLFGYAGLFVAVPILSLIVILVDEAWVKPLDRERGVRPAGEGEVPAHAAQAGEEPAGDAIVIAPAGGDPRARTSGGSEAPRAS